MTLPLSRSLWEFHFAQPLTRIDHQQLISQWNPEKYFYHAQRQKKIRRTLADHE
jgi:hypothetical protein